MNFEESLRQAMRRESPPDGFADRVMQRVRNAPRRDSHARWRVAAAFLLLTSGALGGITVQQIHRQRQGEKAREQVMLALHIAGHKVHYAREQARETMKGNTE